MTEMCKGLQYPLNVDQPKTEEKTLKVAPVWEHEPLAQIPVKELRGHTDSVTSCLFCFNDTRLLTGSHDQTAIFWNVKTGAQLMMFKGGHSDVISRCCLVPQKNRVITSSWDKNVNVWDLETGKILWTVTQSGLLMSCCVSPDGKYVATASDIDNALYINCADTGQKLHYMQGHHKSTVTSCRFDPESLHLASVSQDRSIKLWDICSHKTTLTINNAHTNIISNCCFSHDGSYLCTASWDRTLQLWDVQTGSFRTRGGVQLSKGHEGSISSCAFSSDASVLLSGAFDKTVALWDMKGPCKILTLQGHKSWVTDVDISADKKWVASSSKDCTVRLWNIERYEHIPTVRKSRRSEGIDPQLLKCVECEKPFLASYFVTKCVFCRMKDPGRNPPALPSP